MAVAPLLAALALFACAPAGKPIVAEVYYDANGDDTGWEFVELFNPTAAPVPLALVRLDAGDGSAAARWTTRWTGAARDTIRAHARFVVGGAKVVPVPDATVTLDLQNGPDAVRLVWPDGATETVGWGAHEFPEYSCGASAPDAPSGFAIARVPDGADTGGNAGDFRVAPPTPGVANQSERDLAIARGSLTLAPAQPAPLGDALLSVAVIGAGSTAVADGDASLRLEGDALEAPRTLALAGIGSGDTLRVQLPVRAGFAGRATLRASVALPGDGVPGNDADTLRVRVGDGPLEVTEIQFHPAQGEGEWIEVRNRSGAALRLDGFTLGDRASTPSRVVLATAVPAESLAVIAQDRDAFARAFPQLDTARVAAVGTWASLNNSNDAGGVADVVTLREADGLPVDAVAYSASGVAAGVPIEKTDGVWAAAAGAPGSPLAPPRARANALEFEASPRRLGAGADELQLAWRLPWARGRVTVELFDLEGRRAAVLLRDVASTASGERRVKLDTDREGLFVAQLRAQSDAGTLTRALLLRVSKGSS